MLPIARYRLHWQATTPLHLPAWAASTLRGAWGHALRRLSCITRQKDCPGCPLYRTCPYPALFAPPPVERARQQLSQPPAPYVIEPAGWGETHLAPGETFHFDLVLFGRALQELPLITLAWRQALQRGIGPGDGQAQLTHLQHLSPDGRSPTTIHTPENGQFQAHDLTSPSSTPGTDTTQITLQLHSPLRLQENGRALPPARLTPAHLLMAAVRRSSLIAEFHGKGSPEWDYPALKAAASTVSSTPQLHWQDWTRRSARQQQTMQLGGVLGQWQLAAPAPTLAAFHPALQLCQWLHLGKETVFGLGRYTLSADNSAPARKTCEAHPQPLDFSDKIHMPQ